MSQSSDGAAVAETTAEGLSIESVDAATTDADASSLEPTDEQIEELKAAILEGLTNSETNIDVSDLGIYIDVVDTTAWPPNNPASVSVGAKNVSQWFSEVINENPDLFYVSGSLSFSYYAPSGSWAKLAYITPSYTASGDELATQKSNYETAMADLLSNVPTDSTEIAEVKAVHDWLVENCTYNTSADASVDSSPWTAYGALVNGTPVCEGYALAFKAAMQRLGIDATVVSQWIDSGSTVTSAETGETFEKYDGHSWNRVYADGNWYNLDITFDDSYSSSTSVSYKYFLKSDSWWIANPIYKNTYGSWHTEWSPEGVAGTDTTYDTGFDWATYSAEATESATYTVSLDPFSRHTGADEIDTMCAIVECGWADDSLSGGAVVLASADDWHDALSASGLAGLLDCPVLTTGSEGLDSRTEEQIERLGASTVYIVGGPYWIGADTKAQIEAIDGVDTVEQIYGMYSSDTSYAVYEFGKNINGGWGTTAIVATDGTYTDALAAAPYAYSQHAPVLLTDSYTNPGTVSAEYVTAALSESDCPITTVHIVGGQYWISDSVASSLAVGNVTSDNIERFAASYATDTAAVFAEQEVSEGMTLDAVGVATASDYHDALAGAALCGKNNSVLLLVDSGDSDAAAFLQEHKTAFKHGYILSGQYWISEAMEKDLEQSVL